MIQGLRFLRLLQRKQIQLVHTHDVYTNIFAALWARVGGCRIIASRRWLDDVPRPGLSMLNRWSYRLAHRVLANSALTARLLVDAEGVPARRVLQLPNFLGEDAFERLGPETRNARLRSWGIPPGAFVIGAVARLAPVKNHSVLVRALAHLDKDAHLVLIGAGPARAALEELARTLHVDSQVHFTGELLERTNLHQFFDVSVLCSRSEGFPNSVIEALAAGCPVVATPVGGVPEVIVQGRTGLLVPVDAVDALAAALEELRRDVGLRARLTEAGLSCVRIKYHQSVVIAQLEALYQDLACGAHSKDALLT